MFIDDRVGEPGKNVIILGTCHGWILRTALLAYVPFFKDNAAVHFYPSWFEDLSPILPRAGECDLLIYQPERDAGLEARFATLRGQLPAAARIATFPPIGFTPFWPNLYRDWAAPVDAALGVPRFTFGDRRIVTLLRQGVPPSQAVKQYLATDMAAEVDLDRLYEVWKVNAQQQEAGCDAAVSDLIDAGVRERRLFFSAYHCANFLALRVLDRILEKLRLDPLDAAAFEAEDILHDFDLPIHPSIIRHFGIKYLDENSTYKMLQGERLSFAEYFEQYVEYLVHASAAAAAAAG